MRQLPGSCLVAALHLVDNAGPTAGKLMAWGWVPTTGRWFVGARRCEILRGGMEQYLTPMGPTKLVSNQPRGLRKAAADRQLPGPSNGLGYVGGGG